VFGKRAGESAGKLPVHPKNHDKSQVSAVKERLDKFLTGEREPAGVAGELKLAMWEGAGIFRNLDALEKALSIIKQLKSTSLRAVSTENLVDCCTVANMLTTASLIVESALLRPESRGAHVRKDISQPWSPENSPFGHTYISKNRRGIEKVNE
jgi:fumarate reductase (CoM/CoB) subunit A